MATLRDPKTTRLQTSLLRSLSLKLAAAPLSKLAALCGCILLASCDGSSKGIGNPDTTAAMDEITLLTNGGNMRAKFEQPDSAEPIDLRTISAPTAREKSDDQLLLSEQARILPFPDMWHFKDLLPNAELFCDEPSNNKFAEIAEKLGGFNKTTSIRIIQDATAPRFYNGFEVDFFKRLRTPEVDNSGAGGGVTIQRPDVVGRTASKAFYLSDTYGLIAVDFSAGPLNNPMTSCSLPLPGTPKNFVVTDSHLFVMINDFKTLSSAILQFDITQPGMTFVDALLFEYEDIIDARLFNDTLTLFTKTYEVDKEAEKRADEIILNGKQDDSLSQSPAGGANIDSSRGFGGININGIQIPYIHRTVIDHQLRILNTKPNLELAYTEVFLPGGELDPNETEIKDIEKTRVWTNFNSFLSASGEYLVVTEKVNERHFDFYERLRRSRCTNYQSEQIPYRYCSTNWQRVENPDYVEPPASGVISCAGSLWDCLQVQLPSVAKYIYVPDGETCHDTFRYKYTCLSYESVEYDVPRYRHEDYTNFHVFRFEGGKFIRLDNKLASLEGKQINVSEKPFRINGTVQKHDHINFSNDILYVIANENRVEQFSLNTLSIVGNSAIFVDNLPLQSEKRYSNLSAVFAKESIYLADGSFANSAMNTISLADPLAPAIDNVIKIPTQLEQLVFDSDTLIGVGRSSVNNGTQQYQTFGTLTGFSPLGEEVSSLILGSDYRFYSSSVNWDDQVLTVDKNLSRVLIPYSVRTPLLGDEAEPQQNRVTLAEYDAGKFTELATLNLPQVPNRTLSIDENSAFSFSNEFIHLLYNDADWKTRALFNGSLPEGIYYSRKFPVHVQAKTLPGDYHFKLIDSPESASGELLDELKVSRAKSNICTQERYLFDRDRVMVVKEKEGTYISHEDCPTDRSQAEVTFTGYRITAEKFTPIEDQDELALLYKQANWNLVCLTDLNNNSGKLIKAEEINQDDAIRCYTYTRYNEIVNQKVDEETTPPQQQ